MAFPILLSFKFFTVVAFFFCSSVGFGVVVAYVTLYSGVWIFFARVWLHCTYCTSALTITWFRYMYCRIIFIFDAIDVEHFEFLVLFSLISLTFHQCVGTFYYCYEIVVSCLFAAERHHFVGDKNDGKKTLATVVDR